MHKIKPPLFHAFLVPCPLQCDLQCLPSQPFGTLLNLWVALINRMGRCASMPVLTLILKRLRGLLESTWPLLLSWENANVAHWRIRNHVEKICIIPQHSRLSRTHPSTQLNANTWVSPTPISRTYLRSAQPANAETLRKQ